MRMDAWTQAGLLSLVAAATATDLTVRRIPNAITVSGLSVGLALASRPTGIGMVPALEGAVLALAILAPLFLCRLFGAGDVKLATAIGTFVGPKAIVSILLATALAGGVIALGIALDQGIGRHLYDRLRLMATSAWCPIPPDHPAAPHAKNTVATMPYGPCLAIGCLWWLLTHPSA
jgi:prepilin peptidase CpaA